MRAKKFYETILCNIRGGCTPRKAHKRAAKHNLQDTFGEINYWTGMSLKQAQKFIKEKTII